MIERATFDGPGLYVHVPFCSAICPYCDFSVHKDEETLHQRFVDSLIREIESAAEDGEAAAFDTIYFGGGTPSLLSSEALERIVRHARSSLGARADAWIFLEANPEDVTLDRVAAWRDLGVRTLSLGVQSFEPQELRRLGRRHSADDAKRSVELALEAGFDSVSIDLIYGLPDQDRETLGRNLATATALAPHHVSCYQLTFHQGTPFGRALERGRLRELPEHRQADAFLQVHRGLAEAGYAAYEVSSFAREPAFESRHNRKYWNHTPYLGLGPSAHSFDGENRRWWNHRSLDAWSSAVERGHRPLVDEETLDRRQLASETLILGLRTSTGIDLGSFAARYGIDLLAANSELVDDLVVHGSLRPELLPGHLALTDTGLALADGLAARFELP